MNPLDKILEYRQAKAAVEADVATFLAVQPSEVLVSVNGRSWDTFIRLSVRGPGKKVRALDYPVTQDIVAKWDPVQSVAIIRQVAMMLAKNLHVNKYGHAWQPEPVTFDGVRAVKL